MLEIGNGEAVQGTVFPAGLHIGALPAAAHQVAEPADVRRRDRAGFEHAAHFAVRESTSGQAKQHSIALALRRFMTPSVPFAERRIIIMTEPYEALELEVIVFESEDIVTASGEQPDLWHGW